LRAIRKRLVPKPDSDPPDIDPDDIETCSPARNPDAQPRIRRRPQPGSLLSAPNRSGMLLVRAASAAPAESKLRGQR
jgi:hypothetical protein